MKNIDIQFLENLGWLNYPASANAPENCFYKNPYPIALLRDSNELGFWVIDLSRLKKHNPTIIADLFIRSESDYDKLMVPLLNAIQEKERKNNG